MTRGPRKSTLFPYTTLFRSHRHRGDEEHRCGQRRRNGKPETERREQRQRRGEEQHEMEDRKSTRLNSSHGYISYAVFCLKKKSQTSTSHYKFRRPVKQ